MKSNEIESLPSKSHWFTPSRGKSAVFLTEDQVLLEANFAEKPPEKPPVPDHPVSPETQKLLQDALRDENGTSQQPALHGEGGSEGGSADLARAMGVEHGDFLQQQREAMQEIEQKRRQQLMEEIKQAVPDQSLNVSGQERMLRQISEGRNREAERGRRQERGGGAKYHEQKENVYDTVGPGKYHQGVWKADEHQQSQQSPGQSRIGHQQKNGQHHTQPSRQASDPPLQPEAEQQQPGCYQRDHPTNHNDRAPYGHPPASPRGLASADSYGYPSTDPQLTGPPHSGSSTVSPAMQYPQAGQQHIAYDGQQRSAPPHHAGLQVGSAVQIANNDSRTGVIMWIGTLPGVQGEVAGVALVSLSVLCVWWLTNASHSNGTG